MIQSEGAHSCAGLLPLSIHSFLHGPEFLDKQESKHAMQYKEQTPQKDRSREDISHFRIRPEKTREGHRRLLPQ